MQRVSSMSAVGRGRGARPPGMRIGNLDAQVRAAFFGQGQGGYMLSFEQADWLFQDPNAANQAALPSSPLGLVLDMSKGGARGPQLLANNDWSNGMSGWAYSVVTATTSGNQVTLVRNASAVSQFPRQDVLVPGKTYEVSTSVISLTNAVSFFAGSSEYKVTTPGPKKFTLTATAADFRFGPTDRVDSGNICTVGPVAIREIPGNHFQQATATARPLRLQDAQGYWYGQWDGTDDLMVSLSAVPWAGSVYVTTFAGLYRTGAINAPRVVVETSDNINSINYASAVYSGIDGSNLTSRSKGTIAIDAKVAGNFGVKEVVVAEACPSAPIAAISNSGVSSGDITQSQGAGGFANYLEYVGGRGSTGGFNIQARMYALLRVNSAQRLNAPQIALGQAWVRSKMGV